jgi:hypothetical protein
MWRHKGGEAGMEEALRRLKGALGKGRGWTRGMVRALEERRFAGEAGGGMVELQMNGLGRLLDFKVDPALGRHHVGAIEDLTLTAWNNAMLQARSTIIFCIMQYVIVILNTMLCRWSGRR